MLGPNDLNLCKIHGIIRGYVGRHFPCLTDVLHSRQTDPGVGSRAQLICQATYSISHQGGARTVAKICAQIYRIMWDHAGLYAKTSRVDKKL